MENMQYASMVDGQHCAHAEAGNDGRTDVPHDVVADEQWRLAELSEILRCVLDGVGALDVLRWRPEEAFGDFVRVHHLLVNDVRLAVEYEEMVGLWRSP